MKQKLLKTWLMLCLLLVGVGTTWADEVNFTMGSGKDVTSNSGATKSGITITATDGTSATNNWGGTTYVRLQAGGTLVITPSSATITSIVLNCTSGYEKTWSASTGSAPVVNTTAHTVTWSGSTTSAITLTNTASAQARISSIDVTYTSSGGGGGSTNYTVTVSNSIANGTVTASPTSAAAGATVTLTATPADGYEFGSWNVTNASTSAAITVTNNQFTMPAANVNVSATFNAEQGGGDEPGDDETVVTWIASEQGYTNAVQYTSATVDENISLAFGDGGNDGKYYTTGSGIRLYANGKMTVTASNGATISRIVITYDSGNTGTFSASTGEYSLSSATGTWTGSANSVVLTNTASSGHARIQKIVVTYASDGKTTPSLSFANPTYNATMGEPFVAPTLTNPQSVTVSYASSATGVATVNATTGAISLVAPGTTTITASFAGNEDYNATSASYTLNVTAAPNKYAVNITAPENGTLSVTCDDVDVVSGNTYAVGKDIRIVATPADGYKFRNIQVVDASTHTFTSSNEKVWTMADHEISITANFDVIPTYTVAWSVNGAELQSETLREGADVNVPTDPTAINGKVFTGWIETATVIGETPAYVTPITTASKTVTYYAVFAKHDSEANPDQWQTTTLSALTSSDVFVMASGTNAISSANGTSGNPAAVALTVSAGKITSEVTDDIKWTLTGNASDGYTFYKNGSVNYLYVNTTASSSSNTCIRVGSQSSNIRNNWKPDTNGYLKTNDSYTARYLSFYSTGSDFRGYVNTSNGAFAPTFYKLIPGEEAYSEFTTIPEVTFTSAGTINFVANDGEGNYYATFSSDKITAFPIEPSNDVILNVESVYINADGTITKFDFEDDYTSVNDDMDKVIIPANTGVLLHVFTTEDAAPSVNYEYTNAESETSEYDPEFNMLHAASEDMSSETDYEFFKLAYKKGTNTNLGFYWGNSDGSWYGPKAGGAYLAVLKDAIPQGTRAFVFGQNDTITEISALSVLEDSSTIYTLQGVRMNKLQRGVNIVNGRKVIR